MTEQEFERSKGTLRCLHCPSTEFELKPNPTHYKGVWCKNCKRWRDWIKRPGHSAAAPLVERTDHPWGAPPQKEKPPRYTPNQLAHPINLEERVASLERDVSILAQLLLRKSDA